MANEFKVRKGLVVNGSGSTILDVQGSQGQLFSITDSLSGSLYAVKDISGIPVIEAFSDNTVKMGTFNQEGLIVSGSSNKFGYNQNSTHRFTGSLNVSGSVISNVVPVSVVSSTASVDFTKAGSFFTLNLPANATTHISASIVNAGLSTVMVIKTNTNSVVTFNSAFKQPDGAQYTASASGSTDILSFLTVDSSNIYAISSLKMV